MIRWSLIRGFQVPPLVMFVKELMFKPRGASLILTSVRDIFRLRGFLQMFHWFLFRTRKFSSKMYHITWEWNGPGPMLFHFVATKSSLKHNCRLAQIQFSFQFQMNDQSFLKIIWNFYITYTYEYTTREKLIKQDFIKLY